MTSAKIWCAALICGGAGFAEAAVAAPVDNPWFVHVGPGRLATTEAATVAVAGAPIPGADVAIAAKTTAVVEVGRFVTPTIAVSLTAGFPIEQTVTGAGTLRPYGDLGRVTYGPAAVTVQWRPLPSAAVRPYLGAGVAYLHVFDTKPGTLAGLEAEDDAGFVLQAGVEVPVGRRLALFADAKKGFVQTRVTGTLGPAPVAATVRLDPVVLHAGLALRF